MFADLHVHSTYSDGTNPPEELFRLAEENDVKVIAIADHDSVRGVISAIKGKYAGKVSLIPAIEISTVANRRLLHMLGYYIDVFSHELDLFIQQISKDKTENTRVNFENMKAKNNLDYDWDRVIWLHPDQPRLSGVHVSDAMKHDGVQAKGMTLREMFHTYFMPAGTEFIETESYNAYDAIRIIKKSGGIPVIAHPKSIGDDNIVTDLIHAGVEGLEIYHPSHSAQETLKYEAMANEHKLLVTGGSDWHGKNSSPNVTELGCVGLPNDGYAIFNRMKNKQ